MKSRITITIPEDLVSEADVRAEQLGRSRSWVLVDALRHYLRRPPQVSEPVVTYRTGLGLSRQLQLESDLKLSAEQRVKEAQRTALAVPQGVRRARDQILTFDSYRHYVEWKRTQDVR